MEIKAAWQVARNMLGRREGLTFDFKLVWNNLYSHVC